MQNDLFGDGNVEPFTGSRVETSASREPPGLRRSSPLRARGLKLLELRRADSAGPVEPFTGSRVETSKRNPGLSERRSSPLRARGLKRIKGYPMNLSDLSSPLRARGLKRDQPRRDGQVPVSSPLRARGLKLLGELLDGVGRQVEPFTGSRVETRSCRSSCRSARRRALYGLAG